MRLKGPGSLISYGRPISARNVRRVWAAVTLKPQASCRELGRLLRMQHSNVARALKVLRDAGYVEQPTRSARARRIVVPFMQVTE